MLSKDIIKVMKSLALLTLSLDFFLDVVLATSAEANKHLEMGKQMLAAGNMVEALSHFDSAVEKDPGNYLTFFRRATVYLALGKSKSALPDLDKSIELRPGFVAALTQRGNVYLKQGNLKAAANDFEEIHLNDPSNQEAMNYLHQIEPLAEEIEQAKLLYHSRDYQGAIILLSKAIDLCPWDPDLREIRAECYIAQGDLGKAVSDIRPTTKLRNDNTKGYLKLSRLLYDIGDAEESLSQVKECLKLDPDHKECFPFYKKVKKLAKQLKEAQDLSNSEQYDDCVKKANKILETENKAYHYVLTAKSHRCHCLAKGGHGKDALKACNEALDMDPENANILCDRAEAHIANEDYEAAVKEYQQAMNVDQESRRAKEGMERAQKLLKNSQKRDYYKILGVKRNANKKTIMKAYRKLAAKWHPDKHQGEDKEHAEKMFRDVAAAKEVLTDPEMREKYDHGEDPLDPEQQQGGHAHPFFHGFNPFGNGGGQGFNFKFHFN
ncbi:dnaJ homolog subfamily C member 3-like [Ruditapes philippinarum]|uniref:dnaJ homolog subfamily C member 3-like n=1 Tax=Ruditapes philippinarum TaxID=129788 RepID=UPI00295BE6C0|nr:dnaJ homolog subfamily C member 3-like [Ruditapes philippinarum]